MRKLLLLNCFAVKNGIIKNLKIFSLISVLFLFTGNRIFSQCSPVSGEISGKVLNDVNFNDITDASDTGLEGVEVVAYDTHQKIVSSDITDVIGLYNLTGLTDGTVYRVEFKFPEQYYLSNAFKDILNLKVPECDALLLLHKPSSYIHNNPFIAMPMYIQGKPNENMNSGTILTYPASFTAGTAFQEIAKKSETGAVRGSAFKRTTQQLFTSAFVKQYAYLGPGGIGAIYVSSKTNSGWKTELYVDLASLGVNLGTLDVTDAQDCDYGAQVGYFGLGSIDLSPDEKHLYAMNLYKNTIIKIPTDKSKLHEIEEIQVPNPGCIGGNMHAFALKNYKEKLYVGVSCSAELSKNEVNNTLHIYEYDYNSKIFTEVFQSDWPRGFFANYPANDVKIQQWLVDIEFTDEGNMILALNDRIGHRYCFGTAGRLDVQNGDILMVWKKNGKWQLESNGKAGLLTGSGVGNGQGPGGGEFFGYDFWPTNPALHPETTIGNALVIPGSGEVIVPVYDPEVSAYSGGVKKYSTTNGALNASFSIYTHKTYPQFGKASGFGDIDALYNPLPLEIGDYVWYDNDKDGIQDAGENGVSGLSLSLYDEKCNKVGTTSTNASGYYLFSKANVDLDGNGSFDNLEILKKYYVVIDDSRFSGDALNFGGKKYYLTILNKGVGENKDKNDSDGLIAQGLCTAFDGKPFIEVFTESSGQNKYDADFGFSEVKIFDLALRKTVVTQNTVGYEDNVTFKISVFNQGTLSAFNTHITDYINSGYEYDESINPEWIFNGNKAVFRNTSELKSGDSFDAFITLKVKANSKLNDFINYAEISSSFDSNGNPGEDVDSKMDDILGNDKGGEINYNNSSSVLITDDLTDDDGNIDEDDHDPATINLLDLALMKNVIDEKPFYKIKDTITFGITVYNQGSVAANTYQLVDYLSEDFIFNASLNPGWDKTDPDKVKYTVNEELLPFDNRQVEIKLIVSENAKLENLRNYGEISNITTDFESNSKDYDSTPNAIKEDDSGAEPGTITQHNINLSPKSPVPDEDDHDVATISIKNYDLALKKIAKKHNLKEGETVTFEIEIFNQGAITADKITIVDYIDEGFDLQDSKWHYYQNDSSRAEITLSIANGLLPTVGLLPGRSVKIDITQLLKTVAEGVNYLTNFAEIKESFDIAGNNLGVYDKDSKPDDNKTNDIQGIDDQLDGNGLDDEDDHDWATVFVRTQIILDPCICLNNASNPEDGQFRIEVIVISPSGQEWKIDSLSKFYDLTSPPPPGMPVEYSIGTPLIETFDDPEPGLSKYYIQAIHINNIPYYIRVINNLGDKLELNMHSGLCNYEIPKISGATGTCINSTESFSIKNPNPNASYLWDLPTGGGIFIGSNAGSNVNIQWGNVPGIYDLKVLDNSGGQCIAPTTLKVKIGNSAGSLASEDYIIGSVDTKCELEVTPEMILTTPVNPNIPFKIILIDPDGNELPSNIITSEYIGVEIMATLIDQCGGQTASTIIKAVDFLIPEINCKEIEVDCDQMVSYPGPSVTDNCDPDPLLIITNETSVIQDCSSDFAKLITRSYIAYDKYGNQSEPCTQQINVRRLIKSEVVFPQNWLISDNSALTCNAFKLDEHGNPHPSVSGTPMYHDRDLFAICSDNFCEVTVGYNDFVMADDGCYKKIIRTWHVFENCEEITFANIITHVQTIEIHDLIPAIPVPPVNFTVNTDGLYCSAMVKIPELTITDNCSDEFRVDIFYPGGSMLNSNGGNVRLNAGINDIKYMIYDKCNNLTEVELEVTVVDKTPPVAICQMNTVVSLPPAGEAFVPALVFNSASYDDCNIGKFEVKRMFEDDLGPDVRFDCADLDSGNIMVVLRVYDVEKNWNECMVNVVVQHKYPPTIECPDPIVVECDFPYEKTNLAKYFGIATGFDFCGVTVNEDIPIFDISKCGVGTITRHFVATGRGLLTVDCYQKIEFKNSDPFSLSDIKWPADTTLTGCGIDQLSPNILGWPILQEDQCDLVGYNYEDTQFFGVQEDACYSIVRRWTVIDECLRKDGKFTKYFNDQLIHIKNNTDPYILPLSSIDTCTFDSLCMHGYVTLIAQATDDCTAPDDFQWRCAIDLSSNGTVDTTVYQIGGTAFASGFYPIGTHRILWTVEDRCGNSHTRTQEFRIKNCTKPIPICIDNLVVELGPSLVNGDTIGIANMIARYFDHGSYHPCGYPLKYSFSLDTKDTLLTVDCSWISKKYHDITLYVTDAYGNFDFCTTRLEVQDNFYTCNPFDRCIIWPEDSLIISSCDPDLTPGAGFADELLVNNDCGCDNYEVTYSDQSLINNVTFCSEIIRTWEVNFNCSSLDTTVQFIQTIILENNNVPDLNCSPPVIVDAGPNCNAFVNIPVPTYDSGICNSELTLSHNSLYAAIPGTNASGLYPIGTTSVVYSLTDICGHQSFCTILITVIDITDPICNSNNITVALNSDGLVNITGADVGSGSTDNCGVQMVTVVPTAFGCDDLGPNTVTITVEDVHNNTSNCTAIVTVIDTLTQLCNAQNAILYLNSNGTGVLDPEEVYSGSGGCGGTADVTLEVIPSTFDCTNIGENTVELIVTDNITGMSETCSAIVTVIDEIAPQCLVNGFTVYIGEDGTGSFTFEDIDDGSFDPCGEILDTMLNTSTFTCEDVGLIQSVLVTLTDNSGNISVCQSLITVLDTIKPVCSAVDTLEIPLDALGMVVITGQIVDAGSYDQCGFLALEVTPDTFFCNDADIPIEFLLTVGDGNGNFSICTGILIVRDTTPPNILCPPDTAVSCLGVPEEDMYAEIFGEPLIYDNCSQGGDYVETIVSNVNDCGAGVITRNFTIEDPSGNSSMCTQLIVVEAEPDNFELNDITWPEDTIIVNNCVTLDPESLNSFPIVVLVDAGCAKITVTYEDTNLTPGGDCNDTIQRAWTVKDFCQFGQNPNNGVYTFTQIVIVFDDTAPLIEVPNDTIIFSAQIVCTGTEFVSLPGTVTDCSQNLTVTNNSVYALDPNSADASGYYPYGVHNITVTANDNCGNTSTETFRLELGTEKFCHKNTFIMDEAELIVVHLEDMIDFFGPCDNYSFSPTDPDLDTLVFGCDDIGKHDNYAYLYNFENVLVDSCDCEISIQDPDGFCTGNIVAGIVGSIATENNFGVENAEINVSGAENTKLYSEANGLFEYIPPLPNGKYKVKPKKNNDFLNGVNTLDIIQIQKHILGIKKLDSPYKLIAADVDNNRKVTASDILQLRKLILGETNEFKDNESWKFVDYNYLFQNPEQPLIEAYKEDLEIDKLIKRTRTDFVGIKIGDVNHSAIANKLMSIVGRTSEEMVLTTDELFVKKGGNVSLPLRLLNANVIEGLQFTLEYDTDHLEYAGIVNSKLLLTSENIGIKHSARGKITFTWNDTKAINIDAGTVLFSLEFKVKKSGLLSNLVGINSSITNALVFDAEGVEKGIVLDVRSETTEDFVLYQNEPNPWAISTNIRYNLPRSGQVRLKISNGFGIVLEERVIESLKGANIVIIDQNKIDYTGLLIVDMEFEGKHQIKKMLRF